MRENSWRIILAVFFPSQMLAFNSGVEIETDVEAGDASRQGRRDARSGFS